MKITKTKKVITEEIELKPGEYYFICNDGMYYKTIITQQCGALFIDFEYEQVENFSDAWSIRARKDFTYDEDELPYKFSAYIREVGGKKITKEEFEKQRHEVLNKLK